ncbi:hypothetical protein [Burkholderia gladioli]|uniref:hypothetical protein n=1 Tax=Burkholderia gladioli TaxID=28095 RepID=UPI001ABBC24B|nr:hypothetical protein [Burkholderia gladioli]
MTGLLPRGWPALPQAEFGTPEAQPTCPEKFCWLPPWFEKLCAPICTSRPA